MHWTIRSLSWLQALAWKWNIMWERTQQRGKLLRLERSAIHRRRCRNAWTRIYPLEQVITVFLLIFPTFLLFQMFHVLLQVIEYAKTQSFIFTLTKTYIVLENAILAQKKLFFSKLGSSFEKGILEKLWTCLVFQGRDCPSCSWVCRKPRGKRAHLWFFEGRPHPAVATGHMLSGNGTAQMEEHVCRCIHSCDPHNVWKTRVSIFFYPSIHSSYQNKN